MGASFHRIDEITELAGCDLLPFLPSCWTSCVKQPRSPRSWMVQSHEREERFMWTVNGST